VKKHPNNDKKESTSEYYPSSYFKLAKNGANPLRV
jgi:hypothetical protein